MALSGSSAAQTAAANGHTRKRTRGALQGREGVRYRGGHPYFPEEQNHTHQNNLCSPTPKALGAP
eukprot:5454258-Pyramimonas_sp.AAC.1